MLKLFKSLLGGTPAPRVPVEGLASKVVEQGSETPDFKNDPEYERIARAEIAKRPFFREDAIEAVLLHVLEKRKLFETKTPLSVEEKRNLGINTRLKITAELVAVLNTAGLQSHYPAGIIPDIWIASSFRYRRIGDLKKWRGLRFCKTVSFHAISGIDSCDWCNKTDGKKLDLAQDLDKLLEENCKCEPYWKGYLSPDLEDL